MADHRPAAGLNREAAGLDQEQVDATAAFIAVQQRPDGGIPWTEGGQLDPWDHVESAMALSVAGRWAEAEGAYTFSARTQRADGSWPMMVRGDQVEDPAADTNQCAYLAVGVWHHYLVTGDLGFVHRMWPTVQRATEFVLATQRPTGELAWAVNQYGIHDADALLTGSSSAVQGLECAASVAAAVGADPDRWQAAAARLAHAVRHHPELFTDRGRWSMDWYYPVLGGALRGPAADEHLARGWATFVWPGWGVRCVADRPWVTAAETCEFVLALEAIGDPRAHQLFTDIQKLRDADGGYQMGYVVPDRTAWPEDRPTWTAAAVLLAHDALTGSTPASAVFTDAGATARASGDVAAGCDCRTGALIPS
jgi:hypothetical protein